MYKFEKLDVWNESVLLLKEIYILCKRLPTNEKDNLIDQIRRAATSVSLNIAEGSASQNDKEFRRYLFIAKKSLFEVVAILRIISSLYKINVIKLENQIELLVRRIVSLIKVLDN